MKFRPPTSTRPSMLRLPLTSMIDVIFLLLIFFMATTTFSKPESHLSPGLREERAGASRAADLEPQIVEVRREGAVDVFQIGARVFSDKPALVAALRELPKDPGVFVRVANNVAVGSAAAAVQACRDAGFDKVSYVPGN